MKAHAWHTGRLGVHASELGNVALAVLESAGFGAGVWLGLSLLDSALREPALSVAAPPEAPLIAAVLFLIGRIWVGRAGLAHPWMPRASESILLGLLIGLGARGLAWGWEMVAAYVAVPDALALGLLRGGWRAAALVAPYAFAADRPSRGRAA